MINNESEFLTIREASKYLRVKVSTLRNWSNKGYLKAYRLGKRGDRRFKRADVEAFIKRDIDVKG